MDSARSHYASLLAPVYSWMAGGAEAALARGEAELDSLRLAPRGPTPIAVDLGAGFGMHSIPLARRGFTVVAVDSSAELLRELRTCAGALPIRTVEADLLDFPQQVAGSPEAVLCMGDTLASAGQAGDRVALRKGCGCARARCGVRLDVQGLPREKRRRPSLHLLPRVWG